MPPRDHRAIAESFQQFGFVVGIVGLRQLLNQVEIIPANNAVFDEPLAAFGDLLFLLLGFDQLFGIGPAGAFEQKPTVLKVSVS